MNSIFPHYLFLYSIIIMIGDTSNNVISTNTNQQQIQDEGEVSSGIIYLLNYIRLHLKYPFNRWRINGCQQE